VWPALRRRGGGGGKEEEAAATGGEAAAAVKEDAGDILCDIFCFFAGEWRSDPTRYYWRRGELLPWAYGPAQATLQAKVEGLCRYYPCKPPEINPMHIIFLSHIPIFVRGTN
jgi:hypothetical protein